ncbi:MAG: glycosyltransferase family 4 protein [Planctomycetota bacterium]|jgi:glycosyltransferase involved in cell wall biosynthesis
MKILVLSHNFPRFPDDHPQFILELALSYKKLGHEVEVLACSNKEAYDTSLDFGVTVKRFRYFFKKYETLGWGESSKGDMGISWHAFLMAPLFLIGGILGACGVMLRFKPDIIHAHWVIPNGFIGAIISKVFRTKLIVSLPGSDVQAMRTSALLKRFGLFALNTASSITTNSHDLKNAVVECGANPEKFKFILYGSFAGKVNADKMLIEKIKTKLNIKPDETLVLAVGRLVPKKGFQYLVQSSTFIASDKFKILIVGDGPLKPDFIKKAESLKVRDKVIFVGDVPYSELPQYYIMSDILAAPSVRQPADGLNVVVPEAMKYGLPIVSTSIGGNELVVFDGRNGLHCQEADPESLGSAIDKLIKDQALRQKYGQESLNIFNETASWEVIAKQYAELFSFILSENKNEF